MKTLQLISPDESIQVNYLTDLIGDNEELTVYQIRDLSLNETGSEVLSDAAIAAGLFLNVAEYSLGQFKAFATANEYSLKVFETGEDVVDLIDSIATDFYAFSFPEQTGPATINTGTHTIAIEVANGTSVAALVATFQASVGSVVDVSDVVQVSGTTANDFAAPVVYTITAEDGVTEQDWTVTVTVAAP
jgi:hypothetical protein